MPGISKKENQLEWGCRILMTLDVFVIILGYLNFLQVKNQLISPLIPNDTVYQIISDSNIIKTCLICAIPFVAGLWLYSFKRKSIAILLFILPVAYYLVSGFII